MAEAVICNGTYLGQRSFLNFKILRQAIGLAREYSMNSSYNFEEVSIWSYLSSILYQQMPDQRPINIDDFMIFFKIYENPQLEEAFVDTFGSDVKTLFNHIFLIYVLYMDAIFINWPPKVNGVKLDIRILAKIFAKISMDIQDHRSMGRKHSLVDNTEKFRISTFVSKPITVIKIGEPEIWCPFVGHLIRRLTYGLYYDLIEHDQFKNYIGYAFEQYIGNVITAASSRPWYIYKEAVSGRKKPKSSADWLVADADVALFIECKFRRPLLDSKTEPTNEAAIRRDLGVYASFVAQAIIAAEREHAGLFDRDLPPDSRYIMIVTPEDWHILSSAKHIEVDEMCAQELELKGCDRKIAENYIVLNAGAKSFELFVQAANHFGLSEVLKTHASENHRNDFTSGFVVNNYVGVDGFEPKSIWRSEFDKVFDLSGLIDRDVATDI